MAEPDRLWQVIGFDSFAREHYPLGRYPSRADAMAAAREAMARIDRHQPGETARELQDRVSVHDPQGNRIPIDPLDMQEGT